MTSPSVSPVEPGAGSGVRERLTEAAKWKLDAWLYGWIEGAVGNGPFRSDLLAEHESGVLLVPSRTRAEWWDRRFDPRNPTHWAYWLRSRRSNNVAMVESADGAR